LDGLERGPQPRTLAYAEPLDRSQGHLRYERWGRVDANPRPLPFDADGAHGAGKHVAGRGSFRRTDVERDVARTKEAEDEVERAIDPRGPGHDHVTLRSDDPAGPGLERLQPSREQVHSNELRRVH